VTFLERSRGAADGIKRNLETLNASGYKVLCCDALEFLRSGRGAVPAGQFDVLFLDPPFGTGLLDSALEFARGVLAPGGLVYVESDARVLASARWRVIKEGRAGVVHYGLLLAVDDIGEGTT
jgi:16S rRNA (guanine966-N2)-methyltransferase